jgi:hypothetical protein
MTRMTSSAPTPFTVGLVVTFWNGFQKKAGLVGRIPHSALHRESELSCDLSSKLAGD